MQIVDSPEKTLMLGKTEGRRRMGRQRMRWLDGTSDVERSFWLLPLTSDVEWLLLAMLSSAFTLKVRTLARVCLFSLLFSTSQCS